MSDSGTLSLIDGAERARAPREQPFLFLALRADQPLSPSSRHAIGGVDEIALGRGQERAVRRTREQGQSRLSIAIPDRWMSTRHARIVRERGGFRLTDAGSKNGTFCNGEPVTEPLTLRDGDVIELGRTYFIFRAAIAAEGPDDLEASAIRADAPVFTTLSPMLARTFATLRDVASSNLPVFIGGESGTGKEVVARAVHALSARGGPLIPVNCGAIPANLVESELFGHRKGAFSGATEDRPGLVRASHGGTLFLDEIGDLPLPAQAALLRVLQEREVTPVGGVRPIPVDLRVIAATHRDVVAAVRARTFREDLWSRLAGVSVRLPSLRERREDLGIVIAAVLDRIAPTRAESIAFGLEAARVIVHHRWPRNIRQVERVLATAVVLSRGGVIEKEHLLDAVEELDEHDPNEPDEPDAALGADDLARREELVALFRKHQGNVSAVARELGKARMQIQRWMKRYRIDADALRSR